MFDLFLSLFGIPYYAFKYDFEKHKSDLKDKELEELSQKTKANMQKWRASVVDIDLEKEITSDLEDKSIFTSIERDVKDFFAEIGYTEKHAESVIRLCSGGWYNGDKYKKLLSRIYMAKNGKLLSRDANFGIMVNDNYKKPTTKMEIECKGKLVFWINDQLRSFGVDEKVIADAGSIKYATDRWDICNGNFAGVYKWYPMIPIVDRISIVSI